MVIPHCHPTIETVRQAFPTQIVRIGDSVPAGEQGDRRIQHLI